MENKQQQAMQQKNQKLNEQQVIARLKEAMSTIRRLPPVKVQGYFNAWPDMVYSEIEIMRMDRKPKKLAVTAEAISRMEEAVSWVNLLKKADERQMVWMRANGVPWNEICKILAISRVTANKRYKNAIEKIRIEYV
jgi:hypothetical protein